ncbi:hypothetical protein F511_30780 [Dorcoceras hygrometricum]|uniref:Uncharacterized protein n=1 Tax=Dorcoceras hygrometricum TaxID=472368 RepID=A0A2Z7AWC7_9LAMI|nr:hypothetical protein F511_30780 [Dorcoceras hygrometricum]
MLSKRKLVWSRLELDDSKESELVPTEVRSECVRSGNLDLGCDVMPFSDIRLGASWMTRLEEEREEASYSVSSVRVPIDWFFRSGSAFEMLVIEDVRQYRAPYLPADLVVSHYETRG